MWIVTCGVVWSATRPGIALASSICSRHRTAATVAMPFADLSRTRCKARSLEAQSRSRKALRSFLCKTRHSPRSSQRRALSGLTPHSRAAAIKSCGAQSGSSVLPQTMSFISSRIGFGIGRGRCGERGPAARSGGVIAMAKILGALCALEIPPHNSFEPQGYWQQNSIWLRRRACAASISFFLRKHGCPRADRH
jgi:hypothetical protein